MYFKPLISFMTACVVLVFTNTAFSNVQECGPQSKKTDQIYKVNGNDNILMSAPGGLGRKLINKKATTVLGSTHYQTLDYSVTVREECNESGWSKVRVTDPEWLIDSHMGWVPASVLRRPQINSAGQEEFVEADFSWNERTSPYKEIIVAGVNKAHHEIENCKKMEPGSVGLDPIKSTATEPVFYVVCGEYENLSSVFFSKSEVEKSLPAKTQVEKIQ
jgi:hypothetical protein